MYQIVTEINNKNKKHCGLFAVVNTLWKLCFIITKIIKMLSVVLFFKEVHKNIIHSSNVSAMGNPVAKSPWCKLDQKSDKFLTNIDS